MLLCLVVYVPVMHSFHWVYNPIQPAAPDRPPVREKIMDRDKSTAGLPTGTHLELHARSRGIVEASERRHG